MRGRKTFAQSAYVITMAGGGLVLATGAEGTVTLPTTASVATVANGTRILQPPVFSAFYQT
ncbi:hypothetical protein AB0O34_36080 [Sphaerisporangium sp. NPDC088356]|uniref:hypothetical protein n=1 Tax=Sphaerisporangium sp. NPDC088356 TaxID=3154871 RepID=UPI003445E643